MDNLLKSFLLASSSLLIAAFLSAWVWVIVYIDKKPFTILSCVIGFMMLVAIGYFRLEAK